MAIVIGNDDCPILSLCNTLRHTSAFELSPWEWFQVAQCLIGEDADNIPDDVEYEGYSLYPAYDVLLHMWKDKNGDGATLEVLMEILDDYKLYDATEKLRKRFGCKPKSICDLAKEIQDLDVEIEEKSYLFENISGLADVTNVTDRLLERLTEKKIISHKQICKLKAEDDDSKSLALYSMLADGKFVLSDLIQVLDDDGQFGPSWILRDFYKWAIKNRGSLKTKSIPSSEKENSTLISYRPEYVYLPFIYNINVPHSLDSESGSTRRHRSLDLSKTHLPIC